jgi:hypothetical protein
MSIQIIINHHLLHIGEFIVNENSAGILLAMPLLLIAFTRKVYLPEGKLE